MATIEQILAAIEGMGDEMECTDGRARRPTARQIAAAEKRLGLPLDAEHRALVEAFGYLRICATDAVWPRPQPFEVRPLWQMHYGVEVFGVGAGCPVELDGVAQQSARAAQSRKRLVPAMRRVGDAHVVGYDRKGALYEWQAGTPPTPVEAPGLLSVLASWLKLLAADTARIQADPPAAPAPAPEAGEPDVEELLARTRSRDPDEREEAIFELGLLEAKPAVAVPALLQALEDKAEDVRDSAAEALATYATAAAVPALRAALTRAQKRRGWQQGVEVGSLIKALAACGAGDPEVIDLIASQLLKLEVGTNAMAAFRALNQLGAAARRAERELRACVAQGDAWHVAQAHGVLASLTGNLDEHVPPLIEALANPEQGGAVSAVATAALQSLGERARPFLEAARGHRRAPVRKAAEQLLAPPAPAGAARRGPVAKRR